MPKGKKTCPECKKEQGVRVHTCDCGYDFKAHPKKYIKKEKKVKEEKEVKDSAIYKEVMENATSIFAGHMVSKLTPIEHAERILKLGSERAQLLHRIHKTHICKWDHVDWNYVEEELNK